MIVMVELEQAKRDDSDTLRNMTITAIALAEDLRTTISFGEPGVASKWKRFMTFFSMLHGVTKHFIATGKRKRTDVFMQKWLIYGFSLKKYKELRDKLEEGEDNKEVKKAMKEAAKIFKQVNPTKSLEVFETYVIALKKRGIFRLAEAADAEEGYKG